MGDSLTGKTAVVTGAGGGIGSGIARFLAAEGASVVVNDPGRALDGSGAARAPADDVVAAIEAAGGRAVASYDSVTEFEAGERLVQMAVDSFGGLDIVVTAHGILRDRMVFNMSEQEWDEVIDVHLTGTFNVVRHACTYMRPPALWAHRDRQLDFRAGGQSGTGQLRRGESRHWRADQGCGARHGAVRRHVQLHRPGGLDAHDPERQRRGAGRAGPSAASRGRRSAPRA